MRPDASPRMESLRTRSCETCRRRRGALLKNERRTREENEMVKKLKAPKTVLKTMPKKTATTAKTRGAHSAAKPRRRTTLRSGSNLRWDSRTATSGSFRAKTLRRPRRHPTGSSRRRRSKLWRTECSRTSVSAKARSFPPRRGRVPGRRRWWPLTGRCSSATPASS